MWQEHRLLLSAREENMTEGSMSSWVSLADKEASYKSEISDLIMYIQALSLSQGEVKVFLPEC